MHFAPSAPEINRIKFERDFYHEYVEREKSTKQIGESWFYKFIYSKAVRCNTALYLNMCSIFETCYIFIHLRYDFMSTMLRLLYEYVF